jgi:hypothetical protein
MAIMNKHKNVEGEVALCRNILVVSLRDMVSGGTNHYSRKCRKDADMWLKRDDDRASFSFDKVALYLFGEDVDDRRVRKRLRKMLKNRKIRGTRNLVKILSTINEEMEA